VRDIAGDFVLNLRFVMLEHHRRRTIQQQQQKESSLSGSSSSSRISTILDELEGLKLLDLCKELHDALAIYGQEHSLVLTGLAAPGDPLLDPAALRRLQQQMVSSEPGAGQVVLEYLRQDLNNAESYSLATQLGNFELQQVRLDGMFSWTTAKPCIPAGSALWRLCWTVC
jgi:hypothetical protein